MPQPALKAPFPYFGGKSRIATTIWAALGDVSHYIEPFAGSLAVLLGRPTEHLARQPIETVNDADGMLANFWRAMVYAPESVIRHAETPVNEADLHARHIWLVGQRERITERLMGDPLWCDPMAAGWWVWGLCCWIGSGWCSGDGPWQSVDGVLTKVGNSGRGVNRQLPHWGNAGQGVNRQLPHLGVAGMTRQRYWLGTLVERLRYVRVACGDWHRVVKSTSVLFPQGGTHGASVTGIFLDPPYSIGSEYYATGKQSLQAEVQEWCRANGDNPRLRIVLCGYDGEYDLPGWAVRQWEAGSSYGKSAGKDSPGAQNAKRERLWLSPACLPLEAQGRLL